MYCHQEKKKIMNTYKHKYMYGINTCIITLQYSLTIIHVLYKQICLISLNSRFAFRYWQGTETNRKNNNAFFSNQNKFSLDTKINQYSCWHFLLNKELLQENFKEITCCPAFLLLFHLPYPRLFHSSSSLFFALLY